MFTEPHSTKQIEDCIGWGLETTGEDLVIGERAPDSPGTDASISVLGADPLAHHPERVLGKFRPILGDPSCSFLG